MRRTRKAASSEDSSFTIQQGALMAIIFVALALTLQAAQPVWWTAPGGPLNSNPKNDYALAHQGQLKQFTQKAVLYMDTNLPAGAGTNLNNMVAGWSNYYTTNGFSSTNPAPQDFSAVNQGQLKYIASLIWTNLMTAGYTNAVPTWLTGTNANDYVAANLGQLKTVFNFDLGSLTSSSPQITGPTIVTAEANLALSCNITASNGPTGYSASGLPPGLSVNTSTGVISGTPTTAGVYNVYLGATNSSGTGSAFAVFNIVQSSSAPVINSPVVATGIVGSDITYQVTANNNPLQYGATSTNWPSGISFNSTTGILSGVVTSPNTYYFTLSATNSSGVGTGPLTLVVNSHLTGIPIISGTLTSAATVGGSFTYTVSASNSPTSFGATALPAGLGIDTTTGVISGTPAGYGEYFVALTATNADGTGTGILDLKISPSSPMILSPLAVSGAVGSYLDYFVLANNQPLSFGITGDLPDGLLFNTNNGHISGIPTTPSTNSVTVTASNGTTASGTLTIEITSSHPVVLSETSAVATVGQPFNFAVLANNGPTNYSASGLPSGLVINPDTGFISGTPTMAGTYSVALSVSNSDGTGTATLSITVGNAPDGTTVLPPILYAMEGTNFSYTVSGVAVTNYAASGLPPGFSAINPSTGEISGTATNVGTSLVTVNMTSPSGTYAAQTLLVVESSTNTVTVPSQTFEAGVSPTLGYSVPTATIINDSSDTNSVNEYDPLLGVGAETSTDARRGLIGFDLRYLPPDLTVSSASLTLDRSSNSSIDGIDLHQADTLFDLNSVCWTLNSAPKTNVLSSYTGTSYQPTWSSSTNFVSAVQGAVTGQTPLDLMLIDPDAESHSAQNYYQFASQPGDFSGAIPPQLILSYVTKSPPVIFPSQVVYVGCGTDLNYQVLGLTNGGTFTMSLPGGLSSSSLQIDAATATITGTATATGDYTLAVSGTNANGVGTGNVTLWVGSPATITSSGTIAATIGSNFNFDVTATGSATDYSASGLPDGLSIDPETGVISGTPNINTLMPGPYYATITVNNVYGTSTQDITFTVDYAAPQVSNQTFAGNAGYPLSGAIVANTPVDSFSVTGKPSWLTVDSGTGAVSGTPTATGTYQFQVTATRGSLTSPTGTITLSVADQPTLLVRTISRSVLAGTYLSDGLSYIWSIPWGSNATQPSITWSMSGAPAGISIGSDGFISGPLGTGITGTYTATVTASYGATSTTAFAPIQIANASDPYMFSPLTAYGQVGAYFDMSVATGDEFSSFPDLVVPPGLSYIGYTPTNSEAGFIIGTPTVAGDFPVDIYVTRVSGTTTTTDTFVLEMHISGITSPLTVNGQVGQVFGYTISASNNPTSYGASGLPAGWSCDSVTGSITSSGTMAYADSFPIVVSATGATGTTTGTVTVNITAASSDLSLAFQKGESPSGTYDVPAAVVSNDVADNSVAYGTTSTGTILLVGNTSSTGYSRSQLSFDLSSIPSGATITSAQLILQASANNSYMAVELHQAAQDFDPASATWFINNFYTPSVLGTLNVTPSSSGTNTIYGTAAFASAVQAASNQGEKLNLMLVAPAVESAVQAAGSGSTLPVNYVSFISQASGSTQNPKLVVTYTQGAPTASPIVTSASVASGTSGAAFSYSITANNNPTSYSVDSLPAGLSLNTGTGVISGTLTTVGITSSTIGATNSHGTGTKQITIDCNSSSPATVLGVVSGNNQIGLPGAYLANPLVVQATSSTEPTLVMFTATPGQGLLASTTGTMAPSASLTVVTDSSGIASAKFLLPQKYGPASVTVTSGVATPLTMTGTAVFQLPPGGTDGGVGSAVPILSVVSGQNQTGTSGQVVSYVVQAVNRMGTPLASLSLAAHVTSTDGQVSTTSSGSFGSTATFTTDTNGRATIYMKLAGSAGELNHVACSDSGAFSTVYLNGSIQDTASTISQGGTASNLYVNPDMPADYIAPPSNLTFMPLQIGLDQYGFALYDQTNISISWTASSTAGVSYIFERSIDQGPWQKMASSGVGANDSGLGSGATYTYRVYATDGSHQSAPVSANYIVSAINFIRGTEQLKSWHRLNYIEVGVLAEGTYAMAGDQYQIIFNPVYHSQKINVLGFSNDPWGGVGEITINDNPDTDQGHSPIYTLEGPYFEHGLIATESLPTFNPFDSGGSVYGGQATVNCGGDTSAGFSVTHGTVNWSTSSSHFQVLNASGSPVSSGVSDGTYNIVADADTPPGETVTVTSHMDGGYGQTVTYTANTIYDLSVDEAAGARYRKIAMNGLPLPDEKPQASGETDQEKEETYVDALTLGVRHSTTDAYIPVSGSDFALSARRDFRSEIWNLKSGLRPYEKAVQPFGPCWSSNLGANIEFVQSNNPQKTQPDTAVVTDETGAIHTFVMWGGAYNLGSVQFFPMPTAKNEQQVPNLETLTVNASVKPAIYTFKRKYGTTLVFNDSGLYQTLNDDRSNPTSSTQTEHAYARLVKATDRLGNSMTYHYASGKNLIPDTISVPNQPALTLYIEQTPASGDNHENLVSAIWDANGNKTSYSYASLTTATGEPPLYVLSTVTAADGSITHYGYQADAEADLTPRAADAPGQSDFHVDLASIKDPNENEYDFSYADSSGNPAFDHSKYNYMDNPKIYTGYYPVSAQPRNVTKITMPDGTHADFTNNSRIQLVGGSGTAVHLVGKRQNIVTDATGFSRTYNFTNPQVFNMPQMKALAGNCVTATKVICYQTLSIDYGIVGAPNYAGTESFTFDPDSGMALSSASDLSQNSTTYAHADAWSADSTYFTFYPTYGVDGFNGHYADPTTQTDALGNTKVFTYSAGSRIMTSVTTARPKPSDASYKLVTTYTLDSFERRTKEVMSDSNGVVAQETDFVYGNSSYPGFMTMKTVKALGGSDPSGTVSLVTQYIPDSNGRVAQEIVDPNGLNLVTSYTYDANGNKLTATDPLGHSTWFSYDSRNHLVTVTNADGSQKQMVYDARGNKIKEFDEDGHATLFEYDPLSRLKRQARDMDGSGTINSGDLITCYTYNEVNSKLTSKDPNGHTTSYAYDAIQRVTSITDPLSQQTTFVYGANSGGNAFDSTSFKPTQTTDPRGVVTDVTYDALYRPIIKSVKYDPSAAPSIVSTKYDAVGNAVIVTDPLGHETITAYDALNRPTKTKFADGTYTTENYTSTGLKWQVTDELGHATQTQYDAAGRAIAVLQPSVSDGLGGTSHPTTQNLYDAAGNVVATINPLCQQWNTLYDARNRKIQETSPAVVDATDTHTYRPTTVTTYDAAGNVISKTDPRNNTTTLAYDPANRILTTTQPSVLKPDGTSAQPVITQTYDNVGNVLTATDPNGHVITNAYDALNRLLTTTTNTGTEDIVVTNTYDAVGNKLTVSDGLGQLTSFVYDGLNRNTKVTDASGKYTTLVYDGLNKVRRIDALGHATTYIYDARNRLSNVVYSSSTAANSARVYAYDAHGNLLSVTEPSKTAANVAYTYDALNRAVTETSGGLAHSYVYDLAGNRLSTVYGGTGRTLTSTYDALNRLLSMTDQSAAEATAHGTGRVTAYGYDLSGNIVQKTLPNGDVETDTFDALNRATATSAAAGGGASLYGFTYKYDLAGNVAVVGESYPSGLNNRTVTNTYDNVNRLTQEAVTATTNVTTGYTYDKANNRSGMTVTTGSASPVSTSYTYNNLNQLTGFSDGTRSVALTYDLNGNRATRVVTGGSDNGTDTYSYDIENRLIGLVKGTGGLTGISGGAGTYAYAYDYRTRRITRDESAASGLVTALVFSGGTSVQEYDGGSGTPTVEYVRGSDYGGGVGGILYTIRPVSGVLTPSYTHENKRGDVVAKSDGSGALTYQAQYAAFGNQVATSGSTLDRQKSNSKDTDPTGLVDEGFRYRDLETGGFITRDPAGMISGPNEYTYVKQNPWTSFDPEGLFSWTQFGHDLGHQLAANFKGVATGFVGAASAFGNSIVNDAQSTVNGQLASAVTALATHPELIGTAAQQMAGNAVNAFVKTAGEDGGAGKNIGAAMTLLVGGGAAGDAAATSRVDTVAADINVANKATVPAEPVVTAEKTCGSPTTCFTAGTLVLEDGGAVPIENIQVGDRVLSQDAQHQESTTEVDPATWEDFKLVVENEENSGDPLTVEAIRSPAWIKANAAHAGSRIWFDAEDVGVKGWATIESENPCPPIKAGAGRVVLTTFTHFNNDLFLLQVDRLRQPLEVTGLHRIYSATRHEWVRARDLKLGEELKTRDGELAVTGITHENGTQRVYNFEVEADHTYFVSRDQILVHNACGDLPPGVTRTPNGGVDFSGSPDLYPAGEGQSSIVKIEYTGSRGGDFGAANKEGKLGTTQRAPKDYTWHHLDDYDAASNTGTMQLVKTSTHKSVGHSGGVKQYEDATGKTYK